MPGERILSSSSFVSKEDSFHRDDPAGELLFKEGGGPRMSTSHSVPFSSKGSCHEHQQAEAEGEHSEQHQNFQINAT